MSASRNTRSNFHYYRGSDCILWCSVSRFRLYIVMHRIQQSLSVAKFSSISLGWWCVMLRFCLNPFPNAYFISVESQKFIHLVFVTVLFFLSVTLMLVSVLDCVQWWQSVKELLLVCVGVDCISCCCLIEICNRASWNGGAAVVSSEEWVRVRSTFADPRTIHQHACNTRWAQER